MQNIENDTGSLYIPTMGLPFIRTTLLLLFSLISSYAFAANDFVPDMSRLVIGDFLIYSGRNSERELMLANEFKLPGFLPYNGEHLSNAITGDNYHVFKAFFTISDYFADKNLTLYISRFDMPVTIRINGVLVYNKGLRPETDGAYSTADLPAKDIPIGDGLIAYNKANLLVIEVFPQYETSPLPELSIAEYTCNAAKLFLKNLLDIYLVLAAQFIALLVAIYHLYLFISRDHKEPRYLLFSLLSFSFMLAYANIGFSFDSKYYLTLYTITRCFQTFSIALFFLFILVSVDLFVTQKKYIVTGIIIFGIVCAVSLIVQKDKNSVTQAFSIVANVYLTPLSLFSICLPVIAIIKNKNGNSILFLVVALIAVGASLRDMLLLSSAVQPLFWFAPYAYLLIIIVIYGILLREMRQKEEELTKSHIAIMISQIQPHFLFNSLTAIARLCDKNPAQAKEVTFWFSNYLRGNMESLTEKELIPFEQELKHSQCYLDVEKAIYGTGLHVIYAIEVSDFKLPVLTLQPIIENAVKHGIGRREGGGTVTVSTKETNAAYVLTVTDDGLGFDPGEHKRTGVGITNVTNRLSAMCGGSLTVESELGAGSTVTITIPKGHT